MQWGVCLQSLTQQRGEIAGGGDVVFLNERLPSCEIGEAVEEEKVAVGLGGRQKIVTAVAEVHGGAKELLRFGKGFEDFPF